MPLPTETIVCDVTLATGAEFEAGRASIVFKLDKPDWDTVANEAIPANELRFPLDADGQATVTLWPNDRGNVGSVYQVWVEEASSQFGRGIVQPTKYPVIRVVDGGGPYNLTALFDLSAPPAPFRVVSFLTQAEYDAAIAAGEQAAASAASAALSSASAGAASGRLDVASFGELATRFGYGTAGGREQVAGGDVILWREAGVSYRVLPTIATTPDFDYTGAGGVKLEILPTSTGVYSVRSANPAADGVTDDTDAINLVLRKRGAIYFDPKTYYIAGGSNVPLASSGDVVNDGLRVASNTRLYGNGARLISDAGGATPLNENQFRIITNIHEDGTSENIEIHGFVFEHTGPDGYYTNSIWINGGVRENPENHAKNFLITNCTHIRVRVGVLVRDWNMSRVPIVPENNIRQCSNIKVINTFAKDVTSAVVAPDGNNIIVDNVVSDHSSISLGTDPIRNYDCISQQAGNNVTISNITCTGLLNGYAVLVRNRAGSDTTRVHISKVISNGGKGVRIGTDSTGTTEKLEHITASQIYVDGGSFLVDKSVTTMSARFISLSDIYVRGGSTLDGLAGVGFRLFGPTAAGGAGQPGLTDVNLSNITVDSATGISFVIQEAQDVNARNISVVNAAADQNAMEIRNNCVDLNISGMNLNGGAIGLYFTTPSSIIRRCNIDNLNITGSAVSIGSDASQTDNEITITNLRYDGTITFGMGTNVPSFIESIRGRGPVRVIASDTISVTHQWHEVDTEAAASTDNLSTINGGIAGQVITLSILNNARTVSVLNSGGNIRTKSGSTVALANRNAKIQLIYDGTNWTEV
jgi:hypothetical protein